MRVNFFHRRFPSRTAILIVLWGVIGGVLTADSISIVHITGWVKDRATNAGIPGVAVTVFWQARVLATGFSRQDGKYIVAFEKSSSRNAISIRYSGKSSYLPSHFQDIQIDADKELPPVLLSPYHDEASLHSRDWDYVLDEIEFGAKNAAITGNDLQFIRSLNGPSVPQNVSVRAKEVARLAQQVYDAGSISVVGSTSTKIPSTKEEILERANDWPISRGSYSSWSFSGLDEINAKSISRLEKAWTIDLGPISTIGEIFPVAVSGIIYLATKNGDVFAIDGAKGRVIWRVELVGEWNPSFLSRTNSLGVGLGKVFAVTSDGRLAAINAANGMLEWQVQIASTDDEVAGFGATPLVVRGSVIVQVPGSSTQWRSALAAYDALTGKPQWKTYLISEEHIAESTSSNWTAYESTRFVNAYSARDNKIYWSGTQPDSRGGQKTTVIALNPESGKIHAYLDEITNDYAGIGGTGSDLMVIQRKGEDIVVHPNQAGFVYVYGNKDRSEVRFKNVWQFAKAMTFAKAIDSGTGELIGRRNLRDGRFSDICPSPEGAIGMGSGAYDPIQDLYFHVSQEICADIEVVPLSIRPKNLGAQTYFGAQWKLVPPTSGVTAHLSARNPVSGKIDWELKYKVPPVAGLLATRGGVLFVPGADGRLEGIDSRTGKRLWSRENDSGHSGTAISYVSSGKQHLLVTSGLSGRALKWTSDIFGKTFINEQNSRVNLMAYALSQGTK